MEVLPGDHHVYTDVEIGIVNTVFNAFESSNKGAISTDIIVRFGTCAVKAYENIFEAVIRESLSRTAVSKKCTV